MEPAMIHKFTRHYFAWDGDCWSEIHAERTRYRAISCETEGVYS
jgi:hypothetical protein